MAKEASVAPKERINIVYKPATGNAQAEIELPLKLMVMGDFTGRADSTSLEERKPIQIDKDNFNDVMKSHNLATDINVKNTLSGKEGDEMAVNLKFGTLKDFEPEQVARQVGVSQRQLIQLLRERTGRTFADLLREARIERACEMLAKTDRSVAEIAPEAGFCDQSYFTHVFQKLKRTTPRQYRAVTRGQPHLPHIPDTPAPRQKPAKKYKAAKRRV